MKILIVDDDAMILQLLQLYVGEYLGHETVSVRSGVEALSLIRQFEFNLALIDVHLPDMLGFDVLTQIRLMREPARLPVVIMTAKVTTEAELKTFTMGANDFFRKPLEPEIVMARVRNLLELCRNYGHESGLKTLTPPEQIHDELSTIAQPHPSVQANTETPGVVSQAGVVGPMIPCEMAVLLVFEEGSLFCKTIKVGTGSIMLLVFNEVPAQISFAVQFALPNGETTLVEVLEKERREVQDALGATRLILEVVSGASTYFEFCSQLGHVFQFRGIDGLREVLAGSMTLTRPNIGEETGNAILNTMEGFRYQYVQLLGSGGFASVFLVRDLALKRMVAMKVLSPRLAAHPSARQNFIAEAQIAAQFHHPNIVFVYEVGECQPEDSMRLLDFPRSILDEYHGHLIYFTMHYIKGESVFETLHRGETYTPERTLEIFSGVLHGLAFAHKKGVVHRDIKPGNIMFDENGQILVTDFGIATIRTDEHEKQAVPQECTPRYASPEQLSGKPLDGRSDLYSLGIMLYEMLTGYPPFADKDLAKLAQSHKYIEPKPLIEILPDLPTVLIKAVGLCLAKEPSLRFKDADAALEMLSSYKALKLDDAAGEQTLTRLLEKVLLLEKEGDVVALIDKLIGFLNFYPADQKRNRLRARISEPAVLEALLTRGLAEEHFESLYHFFKVLTSSRAVFTLLRWFERETWPIIKGFLARLAVVSAGTEQKALVDYCIELNDTSAVLMLRAFAEEGKLAESGLIGAWARHRGLQTRLELLRYLRSVKLLSTEERNVLQYFSSETGQSQVRHVAMRLLSGA